MMTKECIQIKKEINIKGVSFIDTPIFTRIFPMKTKNNQRNNIKVGIGIKFFLLLINETI
tara:strand:- start:88 stop:267 length:180 start_codon:yes stop_codon:yes gene_type:complete